MAIRVSSLVWSLAPAAVTPSERLVLLCLADHASPDGHHAFPALDRIARRTSLTRRSVLRNLLRLRAKGFIVKEGQLARKSIRYGLVLDHLEELAHRDKLSQSPRQIVVVATSSDCDNVTLGDDIVAPDRDNFARDRDTVSPDPDLNRIDPSVIRAAARQISPPQEENQDKNNQADDPELPPGITYEQLSPATRAKLEGQATHDPRLAGCLDRAPCAEHPTMIRHWVTRYLRDRQPAPCGRKAEREAGGVR